MNLKHAKTLFCLVTLTYLGVGEISVAQERDGAIPVVFRDLNGNLTKESRKAAKRIETKARRRGTISLWLTLNTPFNVDPSSMSPAEAAAQTQIVQQGFEEMLTPLISKGIVSHPESGPVLFANGCRVVATPKGVRALAADSRVLHMIESRGS